MKYLTQANWHLNLVLLQTRKVTRSLHFLATRTDGHLKQQQTKFVRSPVIQVQQRWISKEIYTTFLSPEFPPIGLAKALLETVHDWTGLPWWASIALATCMLRSLITLPLMAYSYNNAAKLELLQPEIKHMSKELEKEVALAQKKYQWSQKISIYHYKFNIKRHVQKLYVRENCHPLKEHILPFVQIPMWISMSLALRNMMGALPITGLDMTVLCPEMSAEGILWFSNLLLPDSTLILPVILCVTNVAIIEMHNLRVLKASRLQTWITYLMRSLSLLMLPIGASVPSCLCWYWTVSSLYGLGQNVVLCMPRVRRALGISKAPSERTTPFKDMYAIARQRYKL